MTNDLSRSCSQPLFFESDFKHKNIALAAENNSIKGEVRRGRVLMGLIDLTDGHLLPIVDISVCCSTITDVDLT